MTHRTPTEWCWDPLPANAHGWYAFKIAHTITLFNTCVLHVANGVSLGDIAVSDIVLIGSGHAGPFGSAKEAWAFVDLALGVSVADTPAAPPRPRLDLLPTAPLEEVARVLAHGAEKYDPYNWCNGTRWGRCYRALLSHAWAWWRGEDTDPESGLSHLAHCICNLLFLMEYQRNEWGEDDRFRGPTGAAFKKNDGLR